MINSAPLGRRLSAIIRMLALGALLQLVAQAAEATKRNYNLPAGDAAAAFRQFSDVSGKEILFAAETVRGVRTSAVQGEFTPVEALDRLVAGTDLRVVQDEKTGALAVRRATAVQPETSPKAPRSDDGSVLLDKMEINASKVAVLTTRRFSAPTVRAPSVIT